VSNRSAAAVTGSGRAVKLDGVRICGVHACVPKQVIDNTYFEDQFGAHAVADVVKMVGVQRRRWATSDVTGSDLTLVAARALLEKLAWPVDSIDAIIYVTQTPDYKMPATACVLQHRLGLPSHCAAFDMNLGCSAYPYALWVGMSLLRSSGLNRALLCVSETMSKIVDPSDRATALLFGDAATVTALETDPVYPTNHFILGTDGAGFSNLIIAEGARGIAEPVIADKKLPHPNKLYMDGWSVFNFTIGVVPKLVRDSLLQAATEVECVDYFLFHQANLFMLDHLSKKSKIPQGKMPKNIAQFGNTSCASIPLLMTTELGSLKRDRPLTVAMVGFGVGYSWSSVVLQIDAETYLGWTEA
jgi:3-oxoacyl-[acyl-carrier-protein] synthase-3